MQEAGAYPPPRRDPRIVERLQRLHQLLAAADGSAGDNEAVALAGEEPDIAAAYRVGATSYIVKPVDFEAFARAVSEVGLYWLLRNEPPL